MAEMRNFEVEPRTAGGKGPARTLRRRGRVPAVVYGEGKEQQLVSLEARALRRALHDPRFHSTLVALNLNGETIRALPREIQLHPVLDEPIHADFVRVSAGTEVSVEVPVNFVNEEACRGLRRGGVLNIVRREVELVCPSDAIPAEVTVDLEGFDINDSIHISHARLPEGVKPTITDRDFTIATISPPTLSIEEEEEAAAAEAEREAEAEEETPTERAERETPAGDEEE
jgi:large subunit ribosomal protein L25